MLFSHRSLGPVLLTGDRLISMIGMFGRMTHVPGWQSCAVFSPFDPAADEGQPDNEQQSERSYRRKVNPAKQQQPGDKRLGQGRR
jgi:hypothetical protein